MLNLIALLDYIYSTNLPTYHRTALRKLTAKYRNVEGKLERRSIIQDYTHFDSQVYAPLTRTGVYMDSGSERFSVKSKFTDTLEGENSRRC